MKKINLSGLNYEELCELEKEIAKKKKNFMYIGDCYVFDDQDGQPHLCFRSDKCRELYYSWNYYFIFYDVFTKEKVAKIAEKEVEYKDKFYYYLDKANMRYHNEYYNYDNYSQNFRRHVISYTCFKGETYYDNRAYSLETLAILWESVKNVILTSRLDEEQDKLDEKRKKLELTLENKRV